MAAIGNEKYMNELSVNTSYFKKDVEKLFAEGKTIVYTAINNELKGIIAVEDPIKRNSVKAVKMLKEMGIKTVMLTGDNRKIAETIAGKLDIDRFEAEVLPDQKADVVLKYQNKNEIVAMVGDGINDAPALAQSNVGIAIGSGTDIAIEAGSIVLINGDLMDVVNAIKLSRKTIKTIKQNLFWAFIYNVIGIPLAALGMLNPMFAALAMSLSSVSVVSNSLRLKNYKL
jgi:Cu+-exporting ATPase